MSKQNSKYPQVAAKPAPPGAVLLAKLTELAATDFDPADYRLTQKPVAYWCGLCKVRHAPGGVCGYCRGRVRMIREGRVAEIKMQCIEVEPELNRRMPMIRDAGPKIHTVHTPDAEPTGEQS